MRTLANNATRHEFLVDFDAANLAIASQFTGHSAWLPVLDRALRECVQIVGRTRFDDEDAVVNESDGECNVVSVFFMACMDTQMFRECPAALWQNGESPAVIREGWTGITFYVGRVSFRVRMRSATPAGPTVSGAECCAHQYRVGRLSIIHAPYVVHRQHPWPTRRSSHACAFISNRTPGNMITIIPNKAERFLIRN